MLRASILTHIAACGRDVNPAAADSPFVTLASSVVMREAAGIQHCSLFQNVIEMRGLRVVIRLNCSTAYSSTSLYF